MAMWFAASIPPSPISGIFSPCFPSPTSLPPTVPLLLPPNRPQCVMLPSLCPYVLIVQHLPMSENMQCLIFCSCVSLLRMMVSRFIFYGCIVCHGVYVPHFPCPVYHRWAFGLVPSLCYCKQCHNEHSWACVLIIEQYIILWIYTQ